MKVRLHARAWPIPRPMPYGGWEERHIWFGLAFATPGVDEILNLEFVHDLSERQHEMLTSVTGCVTGFSSPLRRLAGVRGGRSPFARYGPD